MSKAGGRGGCRGGVHPSVEGLHSLHPPSSIPCGTARAEATMEETMDEALSDASSARRHMHDVTIV